MIIPNYFAFVLSKTWARRKTTLIAHLSCPLLYCAYAVK